VSSLRLERFCECGGELILDTSDLKAVQVMDEKFSEVHQGEGHAPTTRRKATRARRRQLIRDAENWGRDG
jgi:hypothetical protein